MKKKETIIRIRKDQIPFSCPSNSNSWSMHPRVYINIKDYRGSCPYCGQKFLLEKEKGVEDD